MAEKPAPPRGDSTRAVHGGEREHQRSEAITTPIYQTSTFWFRDSAELRDYQEGRATREEYGRYGNPTWKAVERKICALEGAESAVLFASGMCAATTLFLAKLEPNTHLIVTSDCYRRTRQFLRQYMGRMGVEVSVIEPSNVQALAAAIRPETKLFFSESPTNPYLRVIDLEQAARVCHARGVEVVIDSTFATPINLRPLDHGADYVLHSATKYLGGHNDLLAGVVAGSEARVKPIRDAVGVLGGIVDAHSAWLLLRGLKTLALRMERHNASALAVARWLEAQPQVKQVWYPLLASHPDHATAARTLKGGGGVVTFDLASDLDGAIRFIDACRLPYIAPSLGGVESLIEMPVLMSYWDVPREQRLAMGITDSLVRLSCGIEETDDLIADLAQALRAI